MFAPHKNEKKHEQVKLLHHFRGGFSSTNNDSDIHQYIYF